mgnify:FL=1
MDKLPSNFFSRVELQHLVDRAISLHPDVPSHLTQAVRELATWAATVDSYLGEMGQVAVEPRYARLMQGADERCYEWRDSPHMLHTAIGLFFISIGRQVMIRPGKNGGCMPLNRFRLVLRDPKAAPVYSNVLGDFRPAVEEYLNCFQKVMPTSTDYVQRILGSLFGEEDSPATTATRKEA